MTDHIKREEAEGVEQVQATDALDREVSNSRRALVKGAAGTLPMILTLQSGAALARSSNMMTSASPESAKDQYGRTLCLDKSSVESSSHDNLSAVADLGEPPYARVMAFRDRKYYYWNRNEGAGEIAAHEMCERGGTYYYKRRWGWKEIKVNQGMLCSATALSSFAGKIDIVDI